MKMKKKYIYPSIWHLFTLATFNSGARGGNNNSISMPSLLVAKLVGRKKQTFNLMHKNKHNRTKPTASSLFHLRSIYSTKYSIL